jgi:excinuclease ABC subunit C
MNLEMVKKLNIPVSPGSYQFLNGEGSVIYVGKAANLKSRVCSYWQKSADHNGFKQAMVEEVKKIKWIETDTEIEALLLEANLIKKLQPYYNVLQRDDKRFQYIKITLGDEVPGVFTARKIDKAGRYFGPFVSGLAVKETLKTLRRIWPYCTEKKFQKKPCFYYQINRCAGACGQVVTREEYLEQVINPIIAFLEGRKKEVVRKLEVRSKKLEKQIRKLEVRSKKLEKLESTTPQPLLEKEGREYKSPFKVERLEKLKELENLKYQMGNLNRVLEEARVVSASEKFEADVVELGKILSLPETPRRIEGYDIANIFGREAVGSMVVFVEGEPDKNEYRKFKIRIGQGEANDTGMLREVLERRFAHGLVNNELRIMNNGSEEPPLPPFRKGGSDAWALPDLIVVDGGKGQLNVAVAVLKRAKLDIPVLAISKGEGLRSAGAPDKIFFPGEKKPLQLSLSSPALHIIKRVRDEAHRFAIGYHRKLRGKRFIPHST